MTCTRADVRSCTRGQHLSSHRRVARVLANLRRPCRRAVQTYMFHTPSLQHLGMPGTEYTLACWCGTPHLVTLDALLASKHQFRARSHGTRVWPRVAFPPRPSCAAKLGSLAFKNGVSSEVRNWPSFLVQDLDQVLGVLYFTYNPHLGQFSDINTWSIF